MIGVAKGRGPLVFAHIGVLRAAEPDVERVFDTSCSLIGKAKAEERRMKR